VYFESDEKERNFLIREIRKKTRGNNEYYTLANVIVSELIYLETDKLDQELLLENSEWLDRFHKIKERFKEKSIILKDD
jgi:hypothetical protein